MFPLMLGVLPFWFKKLFAMLAAIVWHSETKTWLVRKQQNWLGNKKQLKKAWIQAEILEEPIMALNFEPVRAIQAEELDQATQ